MSKSFQCAILIASMLSLSLLGGKNLGVTKEIENKREAVLCAVQHSGTETEENTEEGYVLGYTDGFWVEENETVYLLETYGCRVLECSKKSIREILLSDAVLPADIISEGERLYIFDDILLELQIYTKQGELLVRSKIELNDDYVKGLVKTEDGVAVLTYGGLQIVVNPETGEQTCSDKEPVPAVDAAGYDYAEYVGTDEDGVVYSVHTELVKDCSVLSGELTVRAVSPDGECLGSYILPVEEYLYLPGQYIQVADNGNIYVMIPTEQSVEVRKVALKDTVESRLENISEAAAGQEADYTAGSRYRKRMGTACTETISFTREEVWERARAMAEYKWTLKRTHTLTSKSEKGVVLPREIAAIKAANAENSSWSTTMTGIPYCWGGFYALDVGFGGKTFQQVIDKNYVAGNINPMGYLKYLTAGVDCSGFVSAAFGFTKKQSTSGLSDLGSKVSDVKKLEQMDILVYPGDHVIFFCDWLNETTMLVSEAAVREGKVVIHPKSLNQLVVDGKYQMRSPW